MSNKSPQDITLEFIKDISSKDKRVVDFLGIKIVINKHVFPVDSSFSYSSTITAKNIPKNAGIVLDIGTGTGVQGLIAAKRGAKKVLCVDIDNHCLDNAKENIAYHELQDLVEVRKSNLFENISLDEKFDLIISQLPFADVEFDCSVNHFLFDSGFKLHEELLQKAKKYLSLSGRILIPSGDVANEDKLNELIKKYDYSIDTIHEEEFQGKIWKVYVLTA